MSEFLVGLFACMCFVGMMRLIIVPKGAFEYPGLMASIFTGFVLPQLISLAQHPELLPPEGLEKIGSMCILCLLACWLGYAIPPYQPLVRMLTVRVDPARFEIGTYAMLTIGTAFWILANTALEEENLGFTAATGIVTIYFFFAELLYPALGLSLMIALRTRSPWSIAFSAIGIGLPVLRVVMYGRRQTLVTTCMIVALAFYFHMRWTPPRILVILAVIGGAIMIPLAGEYRRLKQSQDSAAAISHIDASTRLQESLEAGEAPEVRTGAWTMHFVESQDKFGWGTQIWNNIVFRLVPAQFVGKDIKENLYLSRTRTEIDDLVRAYGGKMSGTTTTGMADAYTEFWYFGSLLFLLQAVWYRAMWVAADQNQSQPARALYMMMSTTSMLTVTHAVMSLAVTIPINVLFVSTFAYYARADSSSNSL